MLANKTDAAFLHVAAETGMGAAGGTHCGFRRYMRETPALTLQLLKFIYLPKK